MASIGTAENNKIRSQLENQISRLLAQVEDLDSLRAELDDDEYEETKADTVLQLKEMQQNLDKHISGDMTLVDKQGQKRLKEYSVLSKDNYTQLSSRVSGALEKLGSSMSAEEQRKRQAILSMFEKADADGTASEGAVKNLLK